MGKAIDLLEKHGFTSLNGEMFIRENHEADNRIIFDWECYLNNFYPTKIVGYSKHPVMEREECIGVMFEKKDGTRFWVHIPDIDEDHLWGGI